MTMTQEEHRADTLCKALLRLQERERELAARDLALAKSEHEAQQCRFAVVIAQERITQLEKRLEAAARLEHFVDLELAICERQVDQGAKHVLAAVKILQLVKARAKNG